MLPQEMVALVARGRAAWPRIAVSPQAFADHVATRLRASASPSVAPAELHAEDLWLAFAAGSGNKQAIAALDKQLGGVVVMAVARLRNKVSPDDVAQLLREKLLVANGGPLKIFEYSGRGPLMGWLRIAAIRIALSSTRRGDAASMDLVSREVLLAIPATLDDPELGHLRKRHAQDFKWAFESAIATLTVEDRNLLRLTLVDGLTVDELGVLFNIHRSTAARRLERARENVQRETREALAARLQLRSGELKSIMGFVRSHLDLSIQRLLAVEPEAALSRPVSRTVKTTKNRAGGRAK